jgi:hypothetical protein
VRNYKKVHFDRNRLPDAELYWRCRGDKEFKPFGRADYDELRAEFAARERLDLLDR